MKNILITGSSGYIGRHLAALLAVFEDDYHLTGVDKMWRKQLCHEFIGQNILENSEITGKFDTVIHLAGLVNVGMSMQAPMDYYRNNVIGTLNMLERAEYDHFIFASTGAADNPYSPYGMSKLVSENLVRQYCTLNNKKCTIFRFYNVIGTDGFPATNPDGLFYNLTQATKTGQFDLYGKDYNTKDGTCVREYVHVNDICMALIKAIDKPSNQVENLAYGDTRTVKEIVNIFKEVNNVDFSVIYKDARPGDLEACYLKNPSEYMVRNYTYEQMLKL
jgi:UDP-glucose 4-epimerase